MKWQSANLAPILVSVADTVLVGEYLTGSALPVLMESTFGDETMRELARILVSEALARYKQNHERI